MLGLALLILAGALGAAAIAMGLMLPWTGYILLVCAIVVAGFGIVETIIEAMPRIR